jgi:hypothetical protein
MVVSITKEFFIMHRPDLQYRHSKNGTVKRINAELGGVPAITLPTCTKYILGSNGERDTGLTWDPREGPRSSQCRAHRLSPPLF